MNGKIRKPISFEGLGDIELNSKSAFLTFVTSPLLVVPEKVRELIETRTNKGLIEIDGENLVSLPRILDFATFEQLPDEFRILSDNDKKAIISLILNSKSKGNSSKLLRELNRLFVDAVGYLVDNFHLRGEVISRLSNINFKSLDEFILFMNNNPFKNSVSGRFIHCRLLKSMLVLNAIRKNINFQDLGKITNHFRKKVLKMEGFTLVKKDENQISGVFEFLLGNGETCNFSIKFVFDEKTERSVFNKIVSKRKYNTVEAIKDLARFTVFVDSSGNSELDELCYRKIFEFLYQEILTGKVEVEQNSRGGTNMIEPSFFNNFLGVTHEIETRGIENINITGIPNESFPKVIGVNEIEIQIVSSNSRNNEIGLQARPFYEWIDKRLTAQARLMNFGIVSIRNIKYVIEQSIKECEEKGIVLGIDEITVLSKIFTEGKIFPINVTKMSQSGRGNIVFGVKGAYDEGSLYELYKKLPARIGDFAWDELLKMYKKTRTN